ncbi:MAG: 3-oxoacyl-ACP synthase [Planctomycetaceae bacterium]|nr:3-oxoacyl-ACP synthase [Planctomycetaceae bacterium]
MTDAPPSPHARGVRLMGTGMALPARRLANADLEKMVDTSDEWITQRTGIKNRYVVENGSGEGVVDLGSRALTQALQRAQLDPTQLDVLICATMTPDMICPAAACQIVDRVGATPCGAMDLSAACSGFVSALNIAASFIRGGVYQHVAIIGAEVLSSITNWEDRGTCILFGDGAGAAVLGASDDPDQGSLYQTMNSDGGRWNELYCPRNEDHLPETGAAFTGKYDTLQMNGREIYKFAVSTMQGMIRTAMEACDLAPNDIRAVIPHQSNARIIESARDKLGFSEEQMILNIDRYGNTSSASVGLCLNELMEQDALSPGDIILFVALGGGLTWASNVWRL